MAAASAETAASGSTFTTIDFPGADDTFPNGINHVGQIAGEWQTVTTGEHGFLKDGATFTTIDIGLPGNTSASGINDAGQIVGDFHDATGDHGFLATPVPESATWAGAWLGAGGTGAVAEATSRYSYFILIRHRKLKPRTTLK